MERTLLIVDDDYDLRQTLAHFLNRENFTCRQAATGTEALEQLRADPPDLMLLDLVLPDFSGRDLLDIIHDQFQVPVICVSGRKDIIGNLDGTISGAVEYLLKPFEPHALIDCVKRVLGAEPAERR